MCGFFLCCIIIIEIGVCVMYYLFVASKAIEMDSYEEFLNTVIVDEFYFEAISNTKGFIETALPISEVLLSQINLMNEDLGVAISFLGTPNLDDLAYHLVDTILVRKSSGYLSLSDACTLALMNKDTYVREKLLSYFDKIDKELLDNIISFIQHGCNALATSRDLYLHRNTMNYRLSRFSEVTGLDLRCNEHIQLIHLYSLIKENVTII